MQEVAGSLNHQLSHCVILREVWSMMFHLPLFGAITIINWGQPCRFAQLVLLIFRLIALWTISIYFWDSSSTRIKFFPFVIMWRLEGSLGYSQWLNKSGSCHVQQLSGNILRIGTSLDAEIWRHVIYQFLFIYRYINQIRNFQNFLILKGDHLAYRYGANMRYIFYSEGA